MNIPKSWQPYGTLIRTILFVLVWAQIIVAAFADMPLQARVALASISGLELMWLILDGMEAK